MVLSYWYFLLFLISFFIFSFTLWKSKEKKRLIQTFFFISGLAYIMDFVVLVMLNAYQYHPNLVDPLWFDSTFGAIFSQGIAIPTAFMAIAGFNLGFIAIIFIAIGFMGIELLFLSLGAFEHHWWEAWYTGFLFVVGAYLTKVWHRFLQYPSMSVKFTTMYLTLIVYANTMRFFMVLLFATHLYSVGWFSNPIRDHIAGNAFMLFVWMIPVTIVIVLYFRWHWIVSLLAFEWLLDYFLIKAGWLHLSAWWNVSYFVLILLGSLLLFRFIYVKWFFSERIKK
ncbi:hypothetical protein [Virgibacillus sp. DJP39]|uniref:hypothetical protein n=1 Tax=Virgibacillus sp. DJP39 TaxID=3409790 RepID=UPI003BB747AC